MGLNYNVNNNFIFRKSLIVGINGDREARFGKHSDACLDKEDFINIYSKDNCYKGNNCRQNCLNYIKTLNILKGDNVYIYDGYNDFHDFYIIYINLKIERN